MPRNPQPIDLRLLTKVAKMYYDQELTQQEIAKKLYVSRPKVSRLLKQAREEGIVQITVFAPPHTFSALEEDLESKYGLTEAVVVEATRPESQETTAREVGIAAANYLQRTIRPGDAIGVSWGSTLNAMVQALKPSDVEDIHIVQLIGGLGPPEAESHATSLCGRMAQGLGGRQTVIPAPGIVDNEEVKAILFTDQHVQAAFQIFPEINVAYVGIGSPTPDSVLMRDGSIISQQEVDNLKTNGAVGDIALRFFDSTGEIVDAGIEKRVIGISREQLKQIERVVGVAGGPEKFAVISGALVGGWINVLVTDHVTAGHLLKSD